MKDFFLEFLTRPGCHLCEDALPIARRAARISFASLRQTSIESDDDLVKQFGLRIPVVRDPTGTVLAEGHIRLGPLVRRIVVSRLRLRR